MMKKWWEMVCLQTQEHYTYSSVFAEGVVPMNGHLGDTSAFDLVDLNLLYYSVWTVWNWI